MLPRSILDKWLRLLGSWLPHLNSASWPRRWDSFGLRLTIAFHVIAFIISLCVLTMLALFGLSVLLVFVFDSIIVTSIAGLILIVLMHVVLIPGIGQFYFATRDARPWAYWIHTVVHILLFVLNWGFWDPLEPQVSLPLLLLWLLFFTNAVRLALSRPE